MCQPFKYPYRLTLTWDVFKYSEELYKFPKVLGLTLTWDVFKLYSGI